MPVTPKNLYQLHESVLAVLEDQLDKPVVSLKALELAMRFLKDNNIAIDLAKDKKVEVKQHLTLIPRLSDDELKLG